LDTLQTRGSLRAHWPHASLHALCAGRPDVALRAHWSSRPLHALCTRRSNSTHGTCMEREWLDESENANRIRVVQVSNRVQTDKRIQRSSRRTNWADTAGASRAHRALQPLRARGAQRTRNALLTGWADRAGAANRADETLGAGRTDGTLDTCRGVKGQTGLLTGLYTVTQRRPKEPMHSPCRPCSPVGPAGPTAPTGPCGPATPAAVRDCKTPGGGAWSAIRVEFFKTNNMIIRKA
jgi:hypothetical protein